MQFLLQFQINDARVDCRLVLSKKNHTFAE